MRSSTVAVPRATASSAAAEPVAPDVGEEAEVAEVDAEHGCVLRHRDPERAQDGAVAAERDHELALGVPTVGSALVPRSTSVAPTSPAHASITIRWGAQSPEGLLEHADARAGPDA